MASEPITIPPKRESIETCYLDMILETKLRRDVSLAIAQEAEDASLRRLYDRDARIYDQIIAELQVNQRRALKAHDTQASKRTKRITEDADGE